MKTTEQLFANSNSVGSFHDAVYDAHCVADPIWEKRNEEEQAHKWRMLRQEPPPAAMCFAPDTLIEWFNKLPEEIRNIAHSWGLDDTVFRAYAAEEIAKQLKANA